MLPLRVEDHPITGFCPSRYFSNDHLLIFSLKKSAKRNHLVEDFGEALSVQEEQSV